MTIFSDEQLERLRCREIKAQHNTNQVLTSLISQTTRAANAQSIIDKLRGRNSKENSFRYVTDENTFILGCNNWEYANICDMCKHIEQVLDDAKRKVNIFTSINSKGEHTNLHYQFADEKDCVWFKLKFHETYQSYYEKT